ncbi:pyridoxal phosphate-dependent aminotransferase [Streptomyces sp. NPDC050658]|uniref:pyridoxal phosphate-dependent aminotransferase n=1 Tax=unclassified Streptomyces TaxID=2593676 RepID=UPI003413E63F
MHSLTDIIGEPILPNPYDDATLLRRHAAAGHDPTDVIYLSLGETWSQAAPGLRDILASGLPAHSHGYILSPYGLPSLHRELRTYITADHHLAPVAELGVDYEVAVSQNSTRNAMFHFGRLLNETERAARGDGGIVVCSTPGWDYSGVYTALGYTMRHFSLLPEQHYQPNPYEVDKVLHQARRETTGPVLLAVNAQHNPTGANWDPHTVRSMIRSALGTGADLLIDDAYYAVHDPDVRPTNSLRVLLEELRPMPPGRRPHWLAVRSLGKQFHCNGWGIGALTAAPGTVTQLLGNLLPQYTYVSAVPLQEAMARWLQSPSSDLYLAGQRAEYAAKRAEMAHRLTHDFGYPDTAFFPGQCGPYLLMRTPPWYDAAVSGATASGGTVDYRQHCLAQAGVLVGEAHMTTPGHALNDSQGYLRLYLGPPQQSLTEALDRMQGAGLTWHPSPARAPRIA